MKTTTTKNPQKQKTKILNKKAHFLNIHLI